MSSSATTLTLPCRLLAARQRIAGVSRTVRDRPPSSVCQYTTTSGASTVRASPTTSSDDELSGSFLIAGPPRVQCCAQTVPPSCVLDAEVHAPLRGKLHGAVEPQHVVDPSRTV